MSDLSQFLIEEKNIYTSEAEYHQQDSNEIEKYINEIIKYRGAKANEIEITVKKLIKIKTAINNFKTLKNEFIKQSSFDSEIYFAFNNPLARENITNNIAEITDTELDELSIKIESYINQMNQVVERFCQKTVNIGIIGGAKNGKSTLIKKITGLDDDVVPTSDNKFCTGASSVILNSKQFKVEVEFYKEKDLINEIKQKYCEKYSEYGAYNVKLEKVDDIINLLQHLSKQVIKTDSQYIAALKKYYDRREDYKPYLDNKNIVLGEREKAKVREFVSQVGKDGYTEYFKFLAVKKVTIYCPFVVTEVSQIALIDTIGVGETTLGIREKMCQIISDETDFVLMLFKMSCDPTRNLMVHDYELFFDVVNANNQPPSQWLYWVFNRNESDYKPGMFTERYFNELYTRLSLTANRPYPAGILNIDCNNEDEVMHDLMVPMLRHISCHLQSINKQRIEMINGLLKDANADFSKLILKIKTVTLTKEEKESFLIKQFNQSHASMVDQLIKYKDEYIKIKQILIPELNLNGLADELRQAIPEYSEIKREWEITNSYLLAVNFAFEKTRENLVAIVSKNQTDFQAVISDFKSDIAANLLDATGLDQCFAFDMDADDLLLQMAEAFFTNEVLCQDIKNNFLMLNEFKMANDIDARQIISSELKEHLNVNENPDSNEGLFPTEWSKNKDSGINDLMISLLRHIVNISDNLRALHEERRLRPTKYILDMLEQFITQIVNNSNKKGWEYVYRTNAATLWKDKLTQIESSAQRLTKWNEFTKEIIEADEIIEIYTEERKHIH